MDDAEITRHEIAATRTEIHALYARHNGSPSDGWHEAERRQLDVLLHKLNGYSSILEADAEARR